VTESVVEVILKAFKIPYLFLKEMNQLARPSIIAKASSTAADIFAPHTAWCRRVHYHIILGRECERTNVNGWDILIQNI